VTFGHDRDGAEFGALLEIVEADLPIGTRVTEFSVYRLNAERWQLIASRPPGITPKWLSRRPDRRETLGLLALNRGRTKLYVARASPRLRDRVQPRTRGDAR
jgi:hypothetical protein